MNEAVFSKVLNYLQIDESDRRALALRCLFIQGMTRAETAQVVGMSPNSMTVLVDRAVRELRRAGDLTGVYITPVVRRGTTGRKA